MRSSLRARRAARARLSLLAVAAFLLVPAPAAAQGAVTSFDQLNTRLKRGDRIWVTDAKGREFEGKIESLSPDALTLGNGAARTFTARDVALIRDRRRDSLKNGTLIGLGIGGGLAAAWCIGAVAEDDPSLSAGVECAEGLVVYGGLGTLLGLAIDAAIPGKRRVAYRASAASGSARLSIAPVISPRARGVAIAIAF